MYVSTAGAIALLRDLDVVANNVANADTAGFKRDTSVFESALTAALQDADGGTVPGGSGVAYVETPAIATDFRPGPISATGNALDVAVVGDGFFEVETPGGPRYTRAGSFVIGPDRILQTRDGHPVSGDGGPISIGDRPIEILESGEVVDDEGGILGVLKVVSFDEPGRLMKAGSNLFEAPEDATPFSVDPPSLATRSLERSNVVPVRELSTLMMLQRTFDITMRSLQKNDEVTKQLIEEFLT